MADYGDTSGGYSDQQIRDIVAALSPNAPAPASSAAPDVTPTMIYGTPAAPKAKEDNWAPPSPTMAAPTMTPLGALASVRQRAAPMGAVLGVPRVQ